ncbi:MAG TPA: hypothetical protein VEK79_08375 [Thermoanaerobaculia bacterium]|nr:hypothetical protein [Thermoanaerobaculia bacterium]
MQTPLQNRADVLRDGPFLGVPFDDFDRSGREQLIFLLMNGLRPDSQVLDLGCGVLRGGYWLIHFLDAQRYHGIEPHAERLAIGTDIILESETLRLKQPSFDSNTTFDMAIFGKKFDFFLAYSIWTHAPKHQIDLMLDGFIRNSSEDAAFLASFLPARRKADDYTGDQWFGTSHDSDVPGCIQHSFSWIRNTCSRRELHVQMLGRDGIGQIWLRVDRRGTKPMIPELPVRSRSGRAFELLRERMRSYHFV